MLPELLGFILPACKAGLEDPDDDVRAVAADALIPTAAAIVSLKGQTLHSIVMLLWDISLDLDDLSPSTSRYLCILYIYVLSLFFLFTDVCFFTLFLIAREIIFHYKHTATCLLVR